MDVEESYKAAQLLNDQFRDGKEELKSNIVKGALDECPEKFSIDDIVSICDKEFDVTLNCNKVRDSLAQVGDRYVEKISDDKYRIITRPEFDDTKDQLRPVWVEYKEFLQLYDDSADPQITGEIKPLFFDFFERFFLEIAESIEVLNNFNVDTIYTNYGRTDEVIDEVVEGNDATHKGLFRDTIIEYIRDPGSELLTFTDTYYQAALNLDLLRNDAELINFPSIPEENKKIFLDTNIIVLLLAKTDRKHDLAKSLCKRSAEMGFQIHYIPRTAEEVDNLIGGTEYELNNLHLIQNDKNKDTNQLTKHYRNSLDKRKDQYINNLRDWRTCLEEEYNISRFSLEYKSPNENIADDTKERLASQISGQIIDNTFDRINHDSTLLGVTARLREEADFDFGPFVISDHDKLTSLSYEQSEDPKNKSIIGEHPLALQPRSWLNYLLAFTPVGMGDDAKKEISMGILSSSLDIEEEIGIDEYIHGLTGQVGLEKEDEESLRRLLLNHPLGSEVEKALEENDLRKAQGVSSTILQDDEYMERVEEQREFHEQLRKAREYAEEKEAESEKLKEKLENVNSEPSRDDIIETFEELLDDFESSFPGDLSQTQISPPINDPDIQEIKKWLNTTMAIIRKSDPDTIPDQILELVDDMELLYSDCIEYMN